jgi:hypothetical protein
MTVEGDRAIHHILSSIYLLAKAKVDDLGFEHIANLGYSFFVINGRHDICQLLDEIIIFFCYHMGLGVVKELAKDWMQKRCRDSFLGIARTATAYLWYA